MNKRLAFGGLLLIAAALSLTAVSCIKPSTEGAQSIEKPAEKITVYKSPSCGCCVQYIAYLRRQGFEVEVVTTQNTDEVKRESNIPYEMQSCHTSIVGDYFVEGHVPLEAIEKLLAEKPDIDGISLPAMPSGSPGMPGEKYEPFAIQSLTNGEYKEFMKI